ncbi:exodeoxyribonuclease III [Candidatus Saccharibacteria bacterium]|nr:exodeoxyribonuclease III [Candidatus Saccharibacteria bacterium]
MLRIFSWNVNGLRAVINKGALQNFIAAEKPDILCIQETKAKQGQAEIDLPEYEELWNSAVRAGYSGTAIFTKIKPLSVFYGFSENINSGYEWEEDQHGSALTEGRVLTAEFEDFYLVNVYTPNSKHELTRLKLRENLWDPAFLKYISELEKHKPVVVCGDFNAAHTEIDLARPKDNEKNAGYTKEERRGIDSIINAGFIDTFRTLHPDETDRYTWWTWRNMARIRNIGWRIDYFFISKSLLPKLKSAEIHEEIEGSDHCPISIDLEF